MGISQQDLDTLIQQGATWEIRQVALKASRDGEFPAFLAEKAYIYVIRDEIRKEEWSEAARWLDIAMRLREIAKKELYHHPVQGLLLDHLYGRVQIHVGDCRRAVRHLTRFYKKVSEYHPQLHAMLGDNWAAMAEAYRWMGELRREVRNWEWAARSYEEQKRPGKAMDCYAEIAWAYLVRNQVEKAMPYLSRLQDSSDDRPEIKAGLAKALYHVLVGERQEASRYCTGLLGWRCMRYEQKVDVLWVLALMHWNAGEIELARQFVLGAYQFATYQWCGLQIKRVEKLMGEVEEHVGETAH